jgi:hypothetical protein
MLREILNIRQTEPGVTRRWFQSDYFDLFTWAGEDGEISMIQLCYDLRRRERALTWKREIGFFHDGVDDGEGSGPHGTGGNATPILVTNGPFAAEAVNARFMRESADLPIEVRKVVLAKLHEFAMTGPVERTGVPRRNVRRDHWQRRIEAQAAADANGDGGNEDGDGSNGAKN